ncbi:unnamed protein product [Brachionus calyciflorus]|uniref:MULE transposase domain-containing protein n=1 Tax=Brachionus calyciflorus TaxID=104777 RepID=A0A814PR02_9BILA|nr:unnamed protein product [Brachionus calyciflorus]
MVLTALLKEAKNHKIRLEPKYIMTDFELAAINAFKEAFPNIENKGCLFHLCQSFMKKFSELKLKKDYENNEEVSNWFKTVCSLAIVPIDYVNTLFEKLLSTTPDIPNADTFLSYVVDTYFEGNYEVSMWNHFNTNDTPRTNNNLEGYNFRLNKHLSVARPDIYSAINKLKEEEVDASLKYYLFDFAKLEKKTKMVDDGDDKDSADSMSAYEDDENNDEDESDIDE